MSEPKERSPRPGDAVYVKAMKSQRGQWKMMFLLAHVHHRLLTEPAEDPEAVVSADIDPELYGRMERFMDWLEKEVLSQTKMAVHAEMLAAGVEDPQAVEDFVARMMGRKKGGG